MTFIIQQPKRIMFVIFIFFLVITIVHQSFKRNDFQVVANVSTLPNVNQIVTRKDSGISTAKNLINKRIGIAQGTMPQYVLGCIAQTFTNEQV
jgi:hypothetical protein